MRKRHMWILGFLMLLFVVAVAILFRQNIIQIPITNIQRDFEQKAHIKLIQSLRKNDRHLSAFTTDGCSGGLSKAWQTVSNLFPAFAKAHETTPPWEHCCVVHDRSYHSAGGATEVHESNALRLSADKSLRQCILDTGNKRSAELSTKYGLSQDQIRAAYAAIANAMYDAVRVGGLPCSGLEWRWGYGYPRCSGTSAQR